MSRKENGEVSTIVEESRKSRFWMSWAAIGSTILMVFVATVAGLIVDAVFDISPVNSVMLYILAVAFVSLRNGYGAAILASVLSLISFNFFFIPPELTFHVAETQYLITFAGLFSVGLIIADLNARSRQQAEAAYRREQQTALLREKENLQSILLNSISHDLRTPLVSITGALSSLKDDGSHLNEAARQDMLEAAYEDAERLNRLVGNLLEMSRLQAGSLQLKREFYDIQEIISVARAQLRNVLAKREVRVDIEPQLPLLWVDLVLFAQVLVNLLENASKYSTPATAIEIRAYQHRDSVFVEIADRGIGIPEEELRHIFERFYRASSSNGRSGSGLGLSICEGLVELHKGRIHAENRKDGGARFVIQLPIIQAESSQSKAQYVSIKE
jgi:two-component system sensor histidine kinase KdpD